MKSIEMTSGSLWKNILLFSLPLMLTQVLEVLFNLSDVAIAGKYAYNTYVALGAVGSTTTLVSLFTGLLIGMGAGVNVSVARWLGIGDSENVERTTHSSLLICTGAGVLVCLICAFFAEPMLRLLNTKEEFLPGAVLYLRIYALGLPGIGIYNCGNGILSATGDTKRPLIYLSVAGVLNVILNLVFVIGCRMSAEGVAIASAIVNRPLLLIADEPTGNLDPETSRDIMEVFKKINHMGTTVLMVTHDKTLVDMMNKRVIEIDGGKVVRDEQKGGYDDGN